MPSLQVSPLGPHLYPLTVTTTLSVPAYLYYHPLLSQGPARNRRLPDYLFSMRLPLPICVDSVREVYYRGTALITPVRNVTSLSFTSLLVYDGPF